MRFVLGLAGTLVAAAAAPAHFLYLVPVGPEPAFQVVFNDGPQPDDRVNAEPFQRATYRLVTAAGQASDAGPKTGEGSRLRLDGDAAVAYGSVPYGVLFRGDASPVLLVFHAKAVRAGDSAQPVGQPLELTPVGGAGGTSFVVTENGKPVPGADVTVHVPGESKPRVVKADAAGRTPAFSKPGDYAARVYRPTAAAGEFQGRRYAGERHYATVTVRVGTERDFFNEGISAMTSKTK